MTKKRAAISWSSGKDCAYALYMAMQSNEYEIVTLFTTTNQEFKRVAMHGTRNSILNLQAKALGLELINIPLPWPCSNAQYEHCMKLANTQLQKRGIEVMIFGDLFLEDVRSYRENTLEGTGITPIFPIWGHDTKILSAQLIELGFDIRVVTCDPTRLDPSFAGRTFDQDFLNDLPHDVDPCGENGEFHTVVVNAPMFAAPISVDWGQHIIRDGFAYADLIETK